MTLTIGVMQPEEVTSCILEVSSGTKTPKYPQNVETKMYPVSKKFRYRDWMERREWAANNHPDLRHIRWGSLIS